MPEVVVPANNYASQIVLFGIALVAVTLVIQLVRTLRSRHVHRRAQWSLVSKIAKEHGVGDKEWAYLQDLLRRWSGRSPLKAVTVRARFDQCVESEMNQISAQHDLVRFREVGILLRGIREALGFDVVPLGHRMQSTREMRSQQIIWVAAPTTGTPHWAKGVVIAVDEAYFHASLSDAPVAELKANQSAKCWLWREDDARYAFNATLSSVEGNPPVYSFAHSTNLQRLQSRAYYRIHVNHETTLGILATNDNGDDGLGGPTVVTRIRARLSSLSAGGCAAVSQQAPSQNAVLRVGITLPGEVSIEADTRVISVEPVPGGRFLVRMEFVSIRDEYRDIIAKYILRSQLPLSNLSDAARAME